MSMYWDILDAVKTNLTSIVANTVIRRKAQKLETDTLPICIVAPGEDGEKIVQQAFNKVVWYGYPVLVIYIAANNRQMTTGLESYLDVREDIRNELFQTLLDGAASVFDTDMNPQAAIKLKEYLDTNYDVCGFEMTYKVSESRVS